MPEDMPRSICANCKFWYEKGTWCYKQVEEKLCWMTCRHYTYGTFTPPVTKETTHTKKSEAVLQAIRDSVVGDDIIVHNDDGSVWCILEIKSKEMEHGRK